MGRRRLSRLITFLRAIREDFLSRPYTDARSRAVDMIDEAIEEGGTVAEIGRSIREEAEAGYLHHCRQVAGVMFEVRHWDWRRVKSAVGALAEFAFFLLMLLCFPVTIPVAGLVRMNIARRRWANFPAHQAQVDKLHDRYKDRMQSRVQKKEDGPCDPS